MLKLNHQIVVFIAVAVFVTACVAAPSPVVVLPTATDALPTATPITPTATMLPEAQTTPTPAGEVTPMPTSQPTTRETPIRVIIGDTILPAQLWDNATARDLIAQLPLTLTFRDYNRVEKIALLPQKLTMAGVPRGDDPNPREIGYYAPTNDLVFYYDDVGFFNGIVRIGQFDGDLETITSQSGDFMVRIELAE